MPPPQPVACAGPACVQHACTYTIASLDSRFLCTRVYFFFFLQLHVLLIADTVRETLLWPGPYMVAEVDVQVQLRVHSL